MINWDRASLSTVLLDWEGKVTNSVLKTNDPSKFRFCVFKERDCYYIMLNLLLCLLQGTCSSCYCFN